MKSNLDHAPKEAKPESSIREGLRKLGVRSCRIGCYPYFVINFAFLANPWPTVFVTKTDPEDSPSPSQYLSNYLCFQRVRVKHLDALYFSLLLTVFAFSFSVTFVRPSMLPNLIRLHREHRRELRKREAGRAVPAGVDPSRN